MQLTKDLMNEVQGNVLFAAYKLKALGWMIDSLNACPHQIDRDIFIGIGELVKENGEHTRRAADLLDNLSWMVDENFLSQKQNEWNQKIVKLEKDEKKSEPNR